MSELKPCPFCGELPQIAKRQDEDLWSHNLVEWTFVVCMECDVSFSSPPNSEKDAVSRWNTRADSTPRPWLRAEEVRESGSYWWRSPGCPYSVVVGVMLSGTDGSFFAHKDQQGWLKAQPLIALGGLWQRIPEPELPEEEG